MNWTVGKGATIGFALAATVLVVSAALSYRNINRVAANEALVVHTYEVLDALRDSLSTVADAETGQRGYMITGEAPYLAPYQKAIDSIGRHLTRLDALTVDNPEQHGRAAELKEKTLARLNILREGIAARDQDGAEGARQFVLSGQGRREMDAIRNIVAKMARVENELLAVRKAEASTSHRTAVATLLVTALFGLGLVGTAYVLTAREAETRRHGVEALRLANEELEDRVVQRTSDLAATNDSLRRSNRELEQFASVASHDLQEPLRKIQAFGDRLEAKFSEVLGEQGRDYVERMQASALRMRNLIDALLTYSRVTTKAQPFVPVDLEATAREVVSDLEARIQHTGGRVDIASLPTIDADPLQMRQLLQNLIGNGLKFHKPGESPVVRVEGRMVENGQVGPHCEIAVSDNGIGFEEIYLDRIFELFQRLHGRQEYEGTGIGLAICRKIVERHGGSITATSKPDRGTTFKVTVPTNRSREVHAHD